MLPLLQKSKSYLIVLDPSRITPFIFILTAFYPARQYFLLRNFLSTIPKPIGDLFTLLIILNVNLFF